MGGAHYMGTMTIYNLCQAGQKLTYKDSVPFLPGHTDATP